MKHLPLLSAAAVLGLLITACRPPMAPAESSTLASATLPQPPAGDSPVFGPVESSVFQPWTETGLRPEVAVAATVEGSCHSGALTVARPGAWRCSADSKGAQPGPSPQVYDPCFANSFDADGPLACFDAEGHVTLLRLASPLPLPFANLAVRQTLPLSLTLDNGDTCELTAGETIALDGERVNYRCVSGGVLVGAPETGDAIWTIRYSADPRALEAMRVVGIASAVAFQGDTGMVGWSSGSNAAGALENIAWAEDTAADGAMRLIFTFGEDGLPDYEIGYANEPIVNSAGDAQAAAGRERLRLWFRYPRPDTPPFMGEPRITVEGGQNVNSVLLGRSDGGHLVWYVDLDAKAGFHVTRSEDGRHLLLDLFPADPALGRFPEVGVGSFDRAIRALGDRLMAKGYLDEIPTETVFDESLRQAIARFEADHGLVPDGIASPETWALLFRDLPPARSGTAARDILRAKRSLAVQDGPSQVTPVGDAPVNVRSGPGLDFSAIGMLNPGQFADVVSIVPGSDPVTTWYEVCCFSELNGWIRADVVRLFGPGEVPSAQDPPTQGDLGGIPPINRPIETAEGNPILYFTFDDGPMTDGTRRVMDILEANDGRGTFFVIGRQVSWLSDLADEQVARGHSVQNHTYNHASLDTVDRAGFFSEVESTQNTIYAATNTWATCLRPPYGATDGFTFQLAGELGLDVVLWTVDTQDWMRPGAQVIADYILANVHPGAIILMHDGGGDRSQTIAALEMVLPQLRQQGYVFASLCPNQT